MALSLIARCVRGLEWVLAAEVAALVTQSDHQERVRLAERQVTFTVDHLTADLLALRTADDLFLQVGSVDGVDHTRAGLAALPGRLAGLDVARGVARLRALRELPQAPRLDVVASLAGRRNYNRYAVEDAAGAVFAPALRARYVSRAPAAPPPPQAGTDLTVRLFLDGARVHAALRVARRPLHRRPWKLRTGPGTLHPPVGAALARIAGHAPGEVVLDPCCGDGTVAVEAALAAPGSVVLAADLDPARLRNAAANAAAAGAAVRLVQADAARPAFAPGRIDRVVTNPPWNRAVGAGGGLAGGLDPLWRRLPQAFSARGRLCVVADAELGAVRQLRRHGYAVGLVQGVRLAGRVSQIVLASPPGTAGPRLDGDLAAWRRRAVADGIVSDEGF